MLSVKKIARYIFLFVFPFLIILSSCNSNTLNLYEKTQPFPGHVWKHDEKVTITFDITDTLSRYNVYAVLRHLDAYHFNNIWLNITTVDPLQKKVTERANLPLGDDAKGWLGAEMNDIVEHRISLYAEPVKLKKGTYTFTLQHIMREDPLQNMMNAGIRVEKVVE